MPADYDKLTNDFKNLVANDVLSHAYLFFGEDDENRQEKFLFAQSLANFLENGIFEEPDGMLRETLAILPDEEGTIGIDAIRSLKHFLSQKPVSSKRRVAIIKEAENLTSEAQNAALKIVEEPPESALIIFIADVGENLFPTLISRLQKIYFSSAKTEKRGFKKRLPAGASAQAGIKADNLSIELENAIENNQVDEFFKSLIGGLRKDPVKNSKQLKEVLNRLMLMEQFNVNKRLQLRALISAISK